MVKRIFSYCGAYKHYVFLSPVFVMLETAGELALPLLIAKIIDDGIMTGNLSVIYRIGLYMLLLAIAAVVIVHRWKGNVLLSIAGGTALYMLLVQVIFA